MSIARHLKQASLALLTVSSMAGVQSAYAAGTASGTTISNRATVSYSVGGVTQADIISSPTGNVPGGADTTFVVDNKVIHLVAEVSGAADTATPGGTNVLTFTVTNQGNTAQGYLLTATDTTSAPLYAPPADTTDLANYEVRVESGANAGYQELEDIDTSIDSLAPDQAVTVYVLADVLANTANGARANVQLAARATIANSSTLVAETTGSDDPNAVDVVFADAGTTARNGIHEAIDQYLVSSATLTVTKTSSVVSDPFNDTTNPKAIPQAIVQYSIAIANTGGSSAIGVSINDLLPSATTFLQNQYFSETRDVELQVGSNPPTYCVAEAGADTDGDGCHRNANQLVVSAADVATVAAGTTVTVRFRVQIN